MSRLVLITVLLLPGVAAGGISVALPIKAQHVEQTGWARWNPGLAVEYRERRTRGMLYGGAVIRGSLGTWSQQLYAGWLFSPAEGVAVGGRLVLVNRHHNRAGQSPGWLLAPIPTLEAWRGRFGVSFCYIPKRRDVHNSSASVLTSIHFSF